MHRRPLLAIALVCLAASVLAADAAAARPGIWAHRGGAIVAGVPTYPENSLPAFRHAIDADAVLELDVKLTRDGVPVVIHDDTLDRVSNCHGLVRDRTARQIARCRLVWLGRHEPDDPTSCDVARRPRPAGCQLPYRRARFSQRASIPTLAQVLALAVQRHARIAPEIKNIPTDKDFDPTYAYARTVARALARSHVPASRITIQSFLPMNLDVAKRIIPGARFSYLTLKPAAGSPYPEIAHEHRFQWLSPQFETALPDDLVPAAHRLGVRVVPYTVDTPRDVRTAVRQRVDALITDDIAMVRATLHLPPRPVVVSRFRASPRWLCSVRRVPVFRFTLSSATHVNVRIEHRVRGRLVRVATITGGGRRGANVVHWSHGRLRAGAYVAWLRATGAPRIPSARFWVVAR